MAKISEKNRRYRTKLEICNDLSEVLNSKLTYGTKFSVVSEIIWVWSEYSGKYKGCKFWSEEAIKFNLVNKGLIHEHIVPRKILIEKIFSEDNHTPENIYSFLERYCIGVVVTTAEDKKLNDAGLNSKMPTSWSWDNGDPWMRYKEVDIKVQENLEKLGYKEKRGVLK